MYRHCLYCSVASTISLSFVRTSASANTFCLFWLLLSMVSIQRDASFLYLPVGVLCLTLYFILNVCFLSKRLIVSSKRDVVTKLFELCFVFDPWFRGVSFCLVDGDDLSVVYNGLLQAYSDGVEAFNNGISRQFCESWIASEKWNHAISWKWKLHF